MIWLTWRQFRLQAVAAAAALAALTIGYGLTGPHLASLYTQTCGTGTCRGAHLQQFLAAMKADSAYPILYFAGSAVMYLAPLIIGVFWGAPLIARELETGTHRLAWNQSITRRRWLLVKLTVTALAAATFAGLAGLALSWWAAPIDKAGGFPVGISQLSRFQPIIFGTCGIVPISAAALAITLGVTTGLLTRRVIPAMALTLGLFATALAAMPLWISPHLITPAQYTHPVTASLTTMQITSNGQINDPVTTMPGAWILSDQVITPVGQVFELPHVAACQTGTQQQCDAWLASQPLRQRVRYQPVSRYWPFQWYETAIWLAMALALSAGCLWKIKAALPGQASGFLTPGRAAPVGSAAPPHLLPASGQPASPGSPGGAPYGHTGKGPAGGRCPGTRVAMAALAVGLLYAGISAYWGAGGTWLLDTVGNSLTNGGHGNTALIAVWAAAGLKVAAALLPLLACRHATRRGHRRAVRALAWAEAAVLTGYGAVLTTGGLLVQAGVIPTPGTADHRALAWHAYLWDPWFLVWGLLVAASIIAARYGTKGDSRPARGAR